eukprot:TRINITY_DN12852_c0_g1_i2.p3 TRINITY_DN12852_c0_g1~~TRINITY_DN12852_c0_g1_i2.p3  ORF type:complete len:176 (+),score=42.39 TRINITY_DN12852_c0_g1_i2:2383-2910(+)
MDAMRTSLPTVEEMEQLIKVVFLDGQGRTVTNIPMAREGYRMEVRNLLRGSAELTVRPDLLFFYINMLPAINPRYNGLGIIGNAETRAYLQGITDAIVNRMDFIDDPATIIMDQIASSDVASVQLEPSSAVRGTASTTANPLPGADPRIMPTEFKRCPIDIRQLFPVPREVLAKG